VLIDSNNQALSVAQLQALDTNNDGQLTGSETNILRLWQDIIVIVHIKGIITIGANNGTFVDMDFNHGRFPLNVVALNAIRLSIARQNKGQFTIKKNSKIIFNIPLDNTTPVKQYFYLDLFT
jgi:hypothetical protein